MTHPNSDAAFSAAADALWAAEKVIEEAFRTHLDDARAADLRSGLLMFMRLLAAYVADGDGQLSPGEVAAYDAIFWLDRQGMDCWTARDLSQQPDQLEAALSLLEDLVPAMATADGAPNLVTTMVETVLQTVLAADGSDAPELARLGQITSRLRQAIPTPPPPPPGPEPVAHAAPAAPPTASKPVPDVTALLAQLDALVGLASVKHEVETLVNLAKVFALRKRLNMAVPPMSFHLLFLGNPGTGKTTVARIVAQLYGRLGLLRQGQLVEVDRSGLVSQYLGQTATKTQGVITSALGGVLFIDEAYALAEGGPQDYGQEAIATLIKGMEDHRDELVVIAAGYTDQMHKFIAMNPGLRSRMSREIAFDDYSPAEMVAIFRSMAKNADYVLPADCDPTLTATFQQLWDKRSTNFANARDVRNLFEAVVDAQACRVAALPNPTADDLRAITATDLATSTPGTQ